MTLSVGDYVRTKQVAAIVPVEGKILAIDDDGVAYLRAFKIGKDRVPPDKKILKIRMLHNLERSGDR